MSVYNSCLGWLSVFQYNILPLAVISLSCSFRGSTSLFTILFHLFSQFPYFMDAVCDLFFFMQLLPSICISLTHPPLCSCLCCMLQLIPFTATSFNSFVLHHPCTLTLQIHWSILTSLLTNVCKSLLHSRPISGFCAAPNFVYKHHAISPLCISYANMCWVA